MGGGGVTTLLQWRNDLMGYGYVVMIVGFWTVSVRLYRGCQVLVLNCNLKIFNAFWILFLLPSQEPCSNIHFRPSNFSPVALQIYNEDKTSCIQGHKKHTAIYGMYI